MLQSMEQTLRYSGCWSFTEQQPHSANFLVWKGQKDSFRCWWFQTVVHEAASITMPTFLPAFTYQGSLLTVTQSKILLGFPGGFLKQIKYWSRTNNKQK